MKTYLIGPDNFKVLLTPISFAMFHDLDLWSGASDSAYKAFLDHNNLHELCDYNEDFLKTCKIVCELGSDTELYFNPSGDGVVWDAIGAEFTVNRLSKLIEEGHEPPDEYLY